MRVPALRERREDIPVLAQHFLDLYSRQMEKPVRGFAPEVMRLFLDHEWRGNVRELEKTVKRMVVLADEGDMLGRRPAAGRDARVARGTARPRPAAAAVGHASLRSSVSELERRMIAEALERNRWNKAKRGARAGPELPDAARPHQVAPAGATAPLSAAQPPRAAGSTNRFPYPL